MAIDRAMVAFAILALLILFDIASDWNFFAAVYTSVDKYEGVLRDQLEDPAYANELECDCSCTDNKCTATLETTAFCEAYSEFLVRQTANTLTSNTCSPPDLSHLVTPGSPSCTLALRAKGFESRLEDLRRIRWGSLALCVVFTPMMLIFLFLEFRKRTKHIGGLYDLFGFGSISEPITEITVVCPQCNARVQTSHKHCEGCGKQLNHEKETKAYEWFKAFLRIANLRVFMLLFEDLPQTIMLMIYVGRVDSPSGLHCMSCMAKGQFCEYGSGTDRAQVAITVLGTVASMIAFVLQVLLVTRALKVRGASYRITLGGCHVLVGVTLVISLVMCPILFTLAGSEVAEVLDFDLTAKIIIFVVASVLVFPVAFFLFLACSMCFADAECCGDCSLCDCCC